MGVPGLFAFLRRRYPVIVRHVDARSGVLGRGSGAADVSGGVDHLYIDFNHIAHSCTHAHVSKDVTSVSLSDTFAGMAAYLEALLDVAQPRRLVLIAVDGVAPRAKMNQQRTRRFLAAHVANITDRIDAEVRREMTAEAGGGGLTIPHVERMDSNLITPGTEFMRLLGEWLRAWATHMVASDERYGNVTFIVSDSSEPGEGEHKIMRFVRLLRGRPDYDPATTHAVYGQDADLLLLSLLCHEPRFYVLREDMHAGQPPPNKGKGGHISSLQPDLPQHRQLSAVELALQRQAEASRSTAAAAGGGGGGDAVSAEQAAVRAQSEAVAALQPCAEHLTGLPVLEAVDVALMRSCLHWEFAELVGPPPQGSSSSDSSSSPCSGRSGSGSGSSSSSEYGDDDVGSDDGDKRGERSERQDPSSSGSQHRKQHAGEEGKGGGRVAADAGGSSSSCSSSGRGSSSRRRGGTSNSGTGGHTPWLTFEQLLEDLVLLTFLAGNDFLPNVPSLDIYDRPSGLDLLFAAYSAVVPKLGGPIAPGGAVNTPRLLRLFALLARDEAAAYKRRADFRRRRAAAQSEQESSLLDAGVTALLDGAGLSMGELPPGTDLDVLLAGLDPCATSALLGLDAPAGQVDRRGLKGLGPGQLCQELAARVSARVQERLMGGDPWAQDPVGMELPGGRERHYKTRFPELWSRCEGDVDAVAARVAADYVQGISWVLRYYTHGPAALMWQQQTAGPGPCGESGPPPSAAAAAVVPAAGAEGDAVEGASWSWCYPHHYAPLMQDLAKHKLWAKAVRCAPVGSVTVPPVLLRRRLDDPCSCPLLEWAPPGGPVRPLLQLMCVLPARSVADALPTMLAQLVALAEGMEEEELDRQTQALLAATHSGHERGVADPGDAEPGGVTTVLRNAGQQGKAAHKKAAQRAARLQVLQQMEGLSGMELLTVLGEDEWVDDDERGGSGGREDGSSGEDELESADDAISMGSSGMLDFEDPVGDREDVKSSSSGGGGTGGIGPSGRRSSASDDAGIRAASAADSVPGGVGDSRPLLPWFIPSGDADADVARLAQGLCAVFPCDVQQLVDLSGKRWLHTGVVRLPMAQPRVVAAVLQAVLRLQPGHQALTAQELKRNEFRAAAVLAAECHAKACGAVAANSGADDVWLLCASSSSTAPSSCAATAPAPLPQQTPQLQQPDSDTPPVGATGTGTTTTAAAAAAAAAAVPPPVQRPLGALGLLLMRQQGGLPAGAATAVPPAAAAAGGAGGAVQGGGRVHKRAAEAAQQHMRAQPLPVWCGDLDLAGLRVPCNACCLLQGTDEQDTHTMISARAWRRIAAQFSSSLKHAQRVLGVGSGGGRSSGGSGGGGRGDRGGRIGRGVSSGRGRGRGRGPDAAPLKQRRTGPLPPPLPPPPAHMPFVDTHYYRAAESAHLPQHAHGSPLPHRLGRGSSAAHYTGPAPRRSRGRGSGDTLGH